MGDVLKLPMQSPRLWSSKLRNMVFNKNGMFQMGVTVVAEEDFSIIHHHYHQITSRSLITRYRRSNFLVSLVPKIRSNLPI